MRSKRNLKVPQNLEDYVHSINTVKSKNSKNESKNSRKSNEELSKGNQKRYNVERKCDEYCVEDERINSGGNKAGNKDRNESFEGDLNGVQFPPINGMTEVENGKSEGRKECLEKENNCSNQSIESNNCVRGVNGELDDNNNVHEVDNVEEIEEVVSNKKTDSQTKGSEGVGMRFADMIKMNRLDNKLLHVPTKENGNGDNIDEEGINEVINNGPWMVNNKPLVVQKWSIDMCLNKTEPKRIPVWVKLRNVPIEAWSVKGMSALVSSIGKPVIMDEITTKMCVNGVGRMGFAIILVEIDAEKGIKDKIEIIYKSKNISEGTKKIVDVEYSWIPSKCSQCKVFRHTENLCNTLNKGGMNGSSEVMKNNEFKTVQNRKYWREDPNINRNPNGRNGQQGIMWNNRGYVRGNNTWQKRKKFEYKEIKVDERKDKGIDQNVKSYDQTIGIQKSNEQASGGSRSSKEHVEEIQERSVNNINSNSDGVLGSNRFTLLNSLVNEEDLVPNTQQRRIVDEFLSKGNNEKNEVMNGWNEDMKRYYRDRKEMFDAAKEIEENEDVMEENCNINNSVLENEVEGAEVEILI
ncbi:RNA-directed DNA polymerase, eukaryota, reverse transcriptase zinc-binding domain protein [Tanacetum coccineum]|uniref:RNA-directed DNA polymerase, eukaryota, reverse transcriptase zinc-binding domain protein n=1 Tax=Tanacetum coccineum TaxID=301880 RepID=A0ABQ5AJJ7_9ASTR